MGTFALGHILILTLKSRMIASSNTPWLLTPMKARPLTPHYISASNGVVPSEMSLAKTDVGLILNQIRESI
jgi:hypothetical protein